MDCSLATAASTWQTTSMEASSDFVAQTASLYHVNSQQPITTSISDAAEHDVCMEGQSDIDIDINLTSDGSACAAGGATSMARAWQTEDPAVAEHVGDKSHHITPTGFTSLHHSSSAIHLHPSPAAAPHHQLLDHDYQSEISQQPCSTGIHAMCRAQLSGLDSHTPYTSEHSPVHDNSTRHGVSAGGDIARQLLYDEPDGHIHLMSHRQSRVHAKRKPYNRGSFSRPGSSTSSDHSRQTNFAQAMQVQPMVPYQSAHKESLNTQPLTDFDAREHAYVDVDSGMDLEPNMQQQSGHDMQQQHQHQHVYSHQQQQHVHDQHQQQQQHVHDQHQQQQQHVYHQQQHQQQHVHSPHHEQQEQQQQQQPPSAWQNRNAGPLQRLLNGTLDDREMHSLAAHDSTEWQLEYEQSAAHFAHPTFSIPDDSHADALMQSDQAVPPYVVFAQQQVIPENADATVCLDAEPSMHAGYAKQLGTDKTTAEIDVSSLVTGVQEELQSSGLLKSHVEAGEQQHLSTEHVQELLLRHGLLKNAGDLQMPASNERSRQAELLEESLDRSIEGLLLALGMPEIAHGDWQAIIAAGGTSVTGVQGALATVDARRPPGVVATMLQTLLKYRNNVKVTFDTYALEPTPGGLSPDIVKMRQQQYDLFMEVAQLRQRLQQEFDMTLRKPKVALGLFKQLYIAKPCLPEGTQQAQQLAAYIGITPRQLAQDLSNYRRPGRGWPGDLRAALNAMDEHN